MSDRGRLIGRILVFLLLAACIITTICTGGITRKEVILSDGHTYIETYSYLSKGHSIVHSMECPIEKKQQQGNK